MIYFSQLTGLLSQWEGRLQQPDLPQAYKDALRDCSYELSSLMDNECEEEALASINFIPEDVETALQEMEADAWLSSLESHEPAA